MLLLFRGRILTISSIEVVERSGLKASSSISTTVSPTGAIIVGIMRGFLPLVVLLLLFSSFMIGLVVIGCASIADESFLGASITTGNSGCTSKDEDTEKSI